MTIELSRLTLIGGKLGTVTYFFFDIYLCLREEILQPKRRHAHAQVGLFQELQRHLRRQFSKQDRKAARPPRTSNGCGVQKYKEEVASRHKCSTLLAFLARQMAGEAR